MDEIVRWKRKETARHKHVRPLERVQAETVQAPLPRDLAAVLRVPGVSLIAEVKRASPSRGLLCPNFDAVALAQAYQANGAAAVSVLTDQRFFQGHLDHLSAVRQAVRLPVLRKDFILDPYQVYQSRAAGADAILLIVAALSDGDLRLLYGLTRELGMAALIEVHNAAELKRALKVSPRIVGINNRDLRTFNVSLETTANLRPFVPAGVVLVAESGVHTQADVARLAAIGVDAMLVGESLVCAKDVGRQVRELVRRHTVE